MYLNEDYVEIVLKFVAKDDFSAGKSIQRFTKIEGIPDEKTMQDYLRMLAHNGMIVSEWKEENRRIYCLSWEGRKWLDDRQKRSPT